MFKTKNLLIILKISLKNLHF